MKLQNWFLRKLAERELVEWKRDYYTDSEKHSVDWKAEQHRKLEAGEEIEPPWIVFPNSDPTVLWISWRYGNSWLNDIWQPFWGRLNDKQKKEYFEKWQPPDDGWYENITVYWSEGISVKSDWFNEQKSKLKKGEEIEPPWVVFPLSSPKYGWDQGYGESWKLQIWLPFWKKLNENKQKEYLKKWQPPSDEWYKTLTVQWIDKLRKSERWHNKQLEAVQWHGEVEIPWQAFPNNSSIYQWKEAEKEKWLKSIWMPFWNQMSGESQNEYLEHKNPPDNEWVETLEKYKIKNLDKIKEIKPPMFD